MATTQTAAVGVDASGDDGATKDLCLLVTTEISKIADPADHSTNLKCKLRGSSPKKHIKIRNPHL